MPSTERSENLLQSFRFASAGVTSAFINQRNIRIHLVAAVCVLGLAALLRVTLVEWAILVLTIGFVLVAEMINTAIEAVVDLASPDFHELAKLGKDIAAGAVLIAAIVAVAVGLLIFGPAMTELLAG